MKDNNIENLYQKSNTEKTPASLDSFILGQANNSCGINKNTQQKSKRKRWLFSLSSAAVVVLSFSVIFNLQDENATLLDQPKTLERSTSDIINTEEDETKSSGGTVYETAVESAPVDVAPASQVPLMVPKPESEAIINDVVIEEETYSDEAGLSTEAYKDTTGFIANSPQAEFHSEDVITAPKKVMNKVAKKELKEPPKPTMTENYSRANTIEESKIIETVGDNVLQQQLDDLETLINQEKFGDAKILLEKIQKQFPNHDFSQYITRLN